MADTKPNLDQAPKEVVGTIAEGVRVQSENSLGIFDPATLGFSSVVEIGGTEGLTYTRYAGVANMGIDAFLKGFPERVFHDNEKRAWVSDADIFSLINGTLRYL